MNASQGGYFNFRSNKKYFRGGRSQMQKKIQQTLSRCAQRSQRFNPTLPTHQLSFALARSRSTFKSLFEQRLEMDCLARDTQAVVMGEREDFSTATQRSSCTIINNAIDSNPVINKIQGFMLKKEQRQMQLAQAQGVEPKRESSRISFLQIRNLWTNPASQELMLASATNNSSTQ